MSNRITRDIASSQLDVSKKPKKITNPLQAGILKYMLRDECDTALEPSDIPRRYTRYGSLLLLGPTFATHSDAWGEIFGSLTESEKLLLFSEVIKAFSDRTLTHVAINAPIAPFNADTLNNQENVVRSPTGLLPVFGDFGPGLGECDAQYPKKRDFDTAFWTQTAQLNNIVQIWAPRWTMFSRGNISEKDRILGGHSSDTRSFPGMDESALGHAINKADVVDFYVGIGYFAFSYLARGVARVWGWEINGWSVEGLRRGCVRNGWVVRVVKIDQDGTVAQGPDIESLVAEIRCLQGTLDAIRCIVFWGDNKWASTILNKVRSLMDGGTEGDALHVRHCNLGLLPSSQNSWYGAVNALDPYKGGWLHVHENVDTSGIVMKQQEIMSRLKQLMIDCGRTSWSAECCHVEQVKTYAPGVVHCVYDIKLYPLR